ncbi:hypothetical protein FB45DRAFT_1121593 [Roridomyces roridus]|uniref:BTB domain-containing protein n=1 Tax=Roridomyces roridus TaxID=1738132 RepID=A0AAD7B5G6_9AGAR|nr:hypothetical protein FB45DRAFT_1121593 [Roridomyces roridus]
MFAFPSGSSPPTELERDGNSVLVLPETEDVIYRVLILAYPARSHQLYSLSAADLDSACAVHEAAQKYQFTYAQNLLVEMLMDDTLVDAHPHRLFAIAQLQDLPSLGQKAALSTLKLPFCPPNLTFPEMGLLTADKMQKLYDFHRLCSDNASDIFRGACGPLEEHEIGVDSSLSVDDNDFTFVWWVPHSHDGRCGPESDFESGVVVPAKWFRDLMQPVIPKVRLLPTVTNVVSEIAAARVEPWSDCEMCSAEGRKDVERFAIRISRILANKNETSDISARELGILGF